MSPGNWRYIIPLLFCGLQAVAPVYADTQNEDESFEAFRRSVEERGGKKSVSGTTEQDVIESPAHVKKLEDKIKRNQVETAPKSFNPFAATPGIPINNNSTLTVPATEPSAPVQATPKSGNSKPASHPTSETLYIAPPAFATQSDSGSYSVAQEHKRLGVRINTWVYVRIDREVSSADKGTIEAVLSAPLMGKYNIAPAGSTLDGRPSFNEGTRRMDVVFNMLITPSGEKYPIQATIYDGQRRNGLVGSLMRERGKETQTAVEGGVLQGAVTALGVAGGSDPLTQGAATVGQELIKNEDNNREQKPKAVLIVAPQTAMVKFESDF